MTAATTTVFMIVIMIAFAVIVTAIGIVLVLGAAPLPAAENDEEKTGQQDKGENDERFHF